MKRLIVALVAVALCVSAWGQTKVYRLTETGWGRIGETYKQSVLADWVVSDIAIHKWKKATGTFTVNFDKREAVLTQRGKADKTFNLLTEGSPKETRDGWTYVEYMALDGHNSVCHFWLCKHESGAERLLTLYPWTVPTAAYGYLLTPEQE